MAFTTRLAGRADVPRLSAIVDAAIEQLQRPFLTAEQIVSSRAIMGIDTQLIDDGTYVMVVDDRLTGPEAVVGCGGWSRRATLYGNNATPGRDAHLLDPAVDPARVRAMYTDPRHVRRGIGRLVLAWCEEQAASEGFTRLALMATMAGVPLYEAYGFVPVREVEDATGGAPVPLLAMEKPVDARLLADRPMAVSRPTPS